jgi:hypothetical protein
MWARCTVGSANLGALLIYDASAPPSQLETGCNRRVGEVLVGYQLCLCEPPLREFRQVGRSWR